MTPFRLPRALATALLALLLLLSAPAGALADSDEPSLERVSAGVDLVILDLDLPDMHGLDLLRAMRRAGDPTPVFVLSASRADRHRGLSSGADAYFVKPTPMGELLASVRERIGG
jgi:two-component system OmpR family response regulator